MYRLMNQLLSSFIYVFLFSIFINLVTLSYIFYLRIVFDKVIYSSGAIQTLVVLTLAVLILYFVGSFLEVLRSRLLVKSALNFDKKITSKVFHNIFTDKTLKGDQQENSWYQHVTKIRNFLFGQGVFAFFDSPWVLLFLLIIYLFHPVLGIIASAGALILAILIVVQNKVIAKIQKNNGEIINVKSKIHNYIASDESSYVLGMIPSLTKKWNEYNIENAANSNKLAFKKGFFDSCAKFVTMSTVIMVASFGAYLLINEQITYGAFIASFLFVGKCFQPLMLMNNIWGNFVDFKTSFKKINNIVEKEKPKHFEKGVVENPKTLSLNNINYSVAGKQIIKDLSFSMNINELCVITGKSNSGKSILLKIMVGMLRPEAGAIQLNNKDMFELLVDKGFLDQEPQLFSSSIAKNIARMGKINSTNVIEAAKIIDAHKMISSLPAGYDTNSMLLSGGQKQKIAIARAIYNSPLLLALDMPEMYLDSEAKKSLVKMLSTYKQKNKFVIVATHDKEIIEMADKHLTIKGE